MRRLSTAPYLAGVLITILASSLAGCIQHVVGGDQAAESTKAVQTSAAERNCLVRAMYFESNRSSEAGLLAVGTVVMNRVASPLYPKTICGVVGEPHQFAPGVLTRPLDPAELPLVERTADAVLAGKRHKSVGEAMYFHSAAITIPFKAIHYVLVAGGNAFYEKHAVGDRNAPSFEVASAGPATPSKKTGHAAPLLMASTPHLPGSPVPQATAKAVALAEAESAPLVPSRQQALRTKACDTLLPPHSGTAGLEQAGFQPAALTCQVTPTKDAN